MRAHRASTDTEKGCDDLRGQRLSGATACVLVAAFVISSSVAAHNTNYYKVKAGDTLWSLANRFHTTPKAIAKVNGIRENGVLALGKTLAIPGVTSVSRSGAAARTAARAKAVAEQRTSSVAIHTRVDDACLRTGPSTSHAKITTLPVGTSLKLLDRRGKWAKVALPDGKCGFIYRELLAPGAGTVTASAPGDAARDAGGDTASDLVQTAMACRGIRYSRGGTSRGGFDCSGFTRYIFAKYGVSLPHSSAAQSRLGVPVSRDELRPGDLVFFHTYRAGVSHVGIYIGDNRFIHAATHGRGVTVDSLNSSYYAPRYRGARRVRDG